MTCWHPEFVEHLAVWAAEHDRQDVETMCDEVLSGDTDEDVLLGMVSSDPELTEWCDRARYLTRGAS